MKLITQNSGELLLLLNTCSSTMFLLSRKYFDLQSCVFSIKFTESSKAGSTRGKKDFFYNVFNNIA